MFETLQHPLPFPPNGMFSYIYAVVSSCVPLLMILLQNAYVCTYM